MPMAKEFYPMSELTPTPAPQTTNALVMNDFDAAALLDLSVHTLRKMRSTGTGPVYLKIGKSCKYRLSDIHEYIGRSAVSR
jgi:hypothetical protein